MTKKPPPAAPRANRPQPRTQATAPPSRKPARAEPAPRPTHCALSAQVLPAHLLQSLQVDPAQHPNGHAHLSAARGLVRKGQQLFVLADDVLHLGVFTAPADGSNTDTSLSPALGAMLPLTDASLPQGKGKPVKPDLETLCLLPPLPGCPAGALLALSSGSRPGREMAALLALDVHGVPNGRMAQVDLSGLYAPLHKRFVDLNIESALVVSGELLLLHRGNKGNKLRSACIRYDWNLIAPWLAGRQTHPPGHKAVQVLDLGLMNGAPLGFTDAKALHGGVWAFCAVAEPLLSQAGRCAGAAIGIVGAEGQLLQLYPLEGAPKLEGLTAAAEGDGWRLTVAVDPEDKALPAQLLQVVLPPI